MVTVFFFIMEVIISFLHQHPLWTYTKLYFKASGITQVIFMSIFIYNLRLLKCTAQYKTTLIRLIIPSAPKYRLFFYKNVGHSYNEAMCKQ